MRAIILLCILSLFVFVLMSTMHATILVECGVLIRLFAVFFYDLAITLNKTILIYLNVSMMILFNFA